MNPATPADWQETEAIAVGLLERARDLRVLAYLAVARLHLAGLPGFAEVFHQIRSELEHRWQHVHPQLDPEDNNDPTVRSTPCSGCRILRVLRHCGINNWRHGRTRHDKVPRHRGIPRPAGS